MQYCFVAKVVNEIRISFVCIIYFATMVSKSIFTPEWKKKNEIAKKSIFFTKFSILTENELSIELSLVSRLIFILCLIQLNAINSICVATFSIFSFERIEF